MNKLWIKNTFKYVLRLGIPTFLIAIIPTLLSTSSGKQALSSLFHKETGYHIDLESVSLSWFKKQIVTNIAIYKDINQSELIFSAQNLKLSGSLVRLLLYKKPKSIFIENWYLNIDEQNTALLFNTENIKPQNIIYNFNNTTIFSNNGNITVQTINKHQLNISNLFIEKKKYSFQLKALTDENNNKGELSITSSLKPQTEIITSAKQLPASCLRLISTNPLLDNILEHETFFNLSSNLQHKEDNKTYVSFQLTGSQTQAQIKGFIDNNHFYIDDNSPSTIHIDSYITANILSKNIPLPQYTLTSSPLVINITYLDIPITTNTHWSQHQYQAQAFIKKLSLKPINPEQTITLNNTLIKLEKHNHQAKVLTSTNPIFGKINSSHIGQITFDLKKNIASMSCEISSIPHDYFHNYIFQGFKDKIPSSKNIYNFKSKGTYKKNLLSTQSTLQNDKTTLDIQTKGSLTNFFFNGICIQTLPELLKTESSEYQEFDSNIHIDFSGKACFNKHLYLPKLSSKISFNQNAIFIHARLGKNDTPISLDSSSLLIHGKLFNTPLTAASYKLHNFIATETSFAFHSEGAKKLAKGNLKLIMKHKDENIDQATRVLIPDIMIIPSKEEFFSFNNPKITFSGEIFSFYFDHIAKLYEKDFHPSKYLGKSGDITFSGLYLPKEKKQFKLHSSIKSEALKGDVDFAVDEESYLDPHLQGYLNLIISPERYDHWLNDSSCKPTCMLHRTTSFNLELLKLRCQKPKKTTHYLDLLSSAHVEGNLSATPIIFYDKISKDTYIINNLLGVVRSTSLENNIFYDIQGNCLSPDNNPKSPSEFSIKGSINNIFSPQKSFVQTTEWSNIPSSFITGICPITPAIKRRISSLAGTLINVSTVHNLLNGEGPVRINISSSNLQANIPLIATKKALYLESNLQANWHINNAVNKAFLQELNPLLSGGALTQEPIQLTIDKTNFVLPIRPYNLKEFQIQSATLNIGKVSVVNTGDIKELLQFLDITDKKEHIESWFTPIYFSVKNGVVHCKRFDALIDERFRLALWGKTDIVNDRIFMTLGIDPEVIKKHFNNTNLRTKNFFLIKIRGPISSPKTDWSSAYARIGLLKNYNFGGAFNSLVDKLFSSLGDTTPPQTTTPLPWETSPPSRK